jgi:hypothetical protein
MASLDRILRGIRNAEAAGDDRAVAELTKMYNEREQELYGKISGSGDAGFIENVLSGVGAGAVGMYESAALGGAALLEEEEELKARDKIKSVAESFRPEGGDKEALSYKLASGIGSIGALLPTALLGPAALPAAGVIAGGAGAGEASERARAAGATEEERSAATLRGTAIGLTEIAPLGRIAKGLQIPGVQKILDKLGPQTISGIGSRVRSAAATGVAEGAQEAAAAILQNLNERGYNPEAELLNAGVLDEATIGGGAGAIIQALADTIAGRRGGRSVSTESVEEVDDKSDEQAIEEVFGLPALPKTVDIPMPDGSLRENVPVDDPQAQAFLRAQKIQSRAETDDILIERMEAEEEAKVEERRTVEKEALRSVQSKDESIIKDAQPKIARLEDEIETAEIERLIAEDDAARKVREEEYTDLFTDALNEADIKEENAPALAALESNIKERKPKQLTQQQPLGGMQSRTAAKRQGVTRRATETGDESGTTTTTDTERSRDSVAGRGAVVAGREAPEGTRDTVSTDDTRLGSSSDSSEDVRARERTERDALVIQDTTAKELAKLKGISVEAARKKITPKAPNAEAKTILADNNVVVGKDTPQVESVSKDVSTLVKKLTGKKLSTAKSKPKPKTDMQNKLEAIGFTPSSTAKTGEVSSPTDTSTQIEYPTAVPRGTEFTSPDDVTAINTLLDKKIPRDEKGIEQTAQTYLKRFKRPADAFTAIAFEIAENTPKFRVQKGTPTSEVAKFEGTGGANTKATLQWVEKNLSPDAKAEIDKRVVEQQKESAKVEKDVTTRAKQEREDTKVKQRENKLAQDIDKVTAGKAKVVGTTAPSKATPKSEPSPTARADKAAKKKDIVKDAAEKVQGKAKTKPPLTEDMSPAQVSAKIAADTQQFIAGGGKVDMLNLELSPKEVYALVSDVPKDVNALLKKGDLKGALQSLSKNASSKRVKQIARVLSQNLGDMKVEMRGNLEGFDDRVTVSSFDPNTNTVMFDPSVPLTTHAVLHEVTHGAVANVLKNKSHPATKQLESLYKDVKPYFDTAYGAESVSEFVAEVFSNPDFQHPLASINSKGEYISALQRFYRAVTNFVRRLIGMDTKPVGSALDSADAAIMAILSPNAETIDSTAMDGMSTQDGVRKVMDDMTDIQKRVSSGSKRTYIEGATDFLNNSRIENSAKQVWLKLTGSQALGDVARNNGYGQLGLNLHTKFENQRADIQKADERINKVLASYDAWAKKNLEQKQLLDNIIYSQEHGATIYQVDPTLTRVEAKKRYGNQTAQDNRNLFEVWEANQKQWSRLNKGGRDQFSELRNTYKRMHEDLVTVINREIDELGEGKDNASKVKLKKEMNERLIASNTMEVYFPLVRQGNYKLSYTTKIKNDDGTFREEPVFLMFETEGARDSAAKEAKNDALTVTGTVESYDGDTTPSSYRSPPAGSFVADILDVISASGKDPKNEMQEQVMRLFIETLPETSFAKSLQRRKNTLGYIQDARLGMQMKGYDLGAQIEKMRYGGEIRAVEKAIDEVYNKGAPEGVNKKTFKELKKELDVRAKFAREGATNKGPEQYFQRANQTAFIYTIGFNASSALVNMSQIPLVVGPYLASKFGAMESTAALGRASKFVGSSNISIDEYYDIKEVSTTDKDGLVTREDVYTLKPSQEKKIRDTSVDKEKADAKIKHFNRMIPLVKLAKNRGQIHHSTIADQLGVNDVGRQKNKNRALRFLDGTSALSAVMFNAAERFNRQTTVAASYDLNLDKLDAMHEAKGDKKFYSAIQAKFIDVPSSSEARMELAAEEALYFAQETNGGSVLETAAGYSQQGIGRVALMYKSYGLQMYYTMIKSAKLAADNMFASSAEGKELRNMALKQAMGVHLSALFFAGVQGLPLYGAATMIANMFLDDEEDDARTITRKYLGEGWYKGAVTALTGTDVASRVSLSNLLLQENRFNKDPSLEESLGFYLGGPALSTGTRLKRAYDDFNSDEYGSFERGMESLMPAGLTNLYRSTVGRYAREGGIQSRRKDPIYDDMTVGDFASQALGFPPAEYTYRQEISARNKGIEKAITSKRSMLTKKFYVAQRMGDHEVMGEVLDDIITHNKRHPTIAITPKQISKSVKSHMATSAKMHNGVTVNPLMQYAIEVSNREYNKGY